ncbi:hypothetical protein [Haloplanus sp.]|uniref:hypothetical protein n=1 Tax=Haloplanus sp. TaxID=1961696 RepID=UPI0026142E5F|nr:hypothetical protein [Haloplanus sp.]
MSGVTGGDALRPTTAGGGSAVVVEGERGEGQYEHGDRLSPPEIKERRDINPRAAFPAPKHRLRLGLRPRLVRLEHYDPCQLSNLRPGTLPGEPADAGDPVVTEGHPTRSIRSRC